MLHGLEVAMVHRAYRHNPEDVRGAANRLCALAEEHGYSHYRDRCRIFHGWAMAMLDDARAGATLAAEGLAIEREVNTADDFAVFQCLVAEAWTAASEPERALTELVGARAEFERIGLYHWLPEVWRMIGDLTLRVDRQSVEEAAIAYAKAGQLADKQGAHRLALRAAIGAARIALRTGDGAAMKRLAQTRGRVIDAEAGATDLCEADALIALCRERRFGLELDGINRGQMAS
jgi:predicted ATPase